MNRKKLIMTAAHTPLPRYRYGFVKQSHDYIISGAAAIAIFLCLPYISLPAWGSIPILLVDVIAFGVPKVCTLQWPAERCGFAPPNQLETQAIMATLYYAGSSPLGAMRRHCSRRARMDP